MSESDSRVISLAWFYKEQFGFSKAPPLSDPEVVSNMARALVAVASADGDLSAPERSWILGYLATKGYPESVLDEVRSMTDTKTLAVEHLMQLGILAKSGRILIYDAIRAASADGYSDRERAAVHRVARALDIDDAVVAQLEHLVVEEQALTKKRIQLLMPDGHPNL